MHKRSTSCWDTALMPLAAPPGLHISPCTLLGLPNPVCALCRALAQHKALQRHRQLCGLGAHIALYGQPSSVMLLAVRCCSRCAEWLLQQAKKKESQPSKHISKGLVMTVLFVGAGPGARGQRALISPSNCSSLGEQPGWAPMLRIQSSLGFLWKVPLIDMRK